MVGIISNGYPHRSLGELNLDNKYQAYYATKMALWCYLLPNWNIANLKVAPGLTGSELDIGNRILAAAKDIYKRGIKRAIRSHASTYCKGPNDSAVPPFLVPAKMLRQMTFYLCRNPLVYPLTQEIRCIYHTEL